MEERYQVIADALGELDEEAFNARVESFVGSDPSEEEADKVIKSFSMGMDKVGEYFEEGEYFVGDLVYAADILYNGIDAIKPFLSSDGSSKIGSMVLGSAPGDLHDIGKNIFKSMAEAGGFEVHDLGVDVKPEVFVKKVKEVKPNIVGISGLLTLSLETMGDVINALKDAGLRDNLKIMIGGNPVSEAVMERVGADAWSTNASTGVKQLKEWVV